MPLLSNALLTLVIVRHQPPLARLGWWLSLALVLQRYWLIAFLNTLLIGVELAKHLSSKASAWASANLIKILLFLLGMVGGLVLGFG